MPRSAASPGRCYVATRPRPLLLRRWQRTARRHRTATGRARRRGMCVRRVAAVRRESGALRRRYDEDKWLRTLNKQRTCYLYVNTLTQVGTPTFYLKSLNRDLGPLALNPSRKRPSRTPESPTLTLKPATAAHVLPLHKKKAPSGPSRLLRWCLHAHERLRAVAEAACEGMPSVTVVDRAS